MSEQRVLICGVDGYLGWILANYLVARGFIVAGIDNYSRRQWVAEEGCQSATPIKHMTERLRAFRKKYDKNLLFIKCDLRDYHQLCHIIRKFNPDTIVQLGEMPSAPFSMIDFEHAWFAHENNLKGTMALLFAMRDICPDAHLVKLGTMGEYGTPNVEILEGFFGPNDKLRDRSLDGLLFPRKPASLYHATKVEGSTIIELACRFWGLKATDIMQGVVFGIRIPEIVDNKGDLDEDLCTRFDFGECFGTALNRFCAQAVIGHPLTVFGAGHQKRGFITLADSIQCLALAIKNSPIEGEYGTRNGYRIFNQFEEVYDLTELAEKVAAAINRIGLSANVIIRNVENPRIESENPYYNPDHQHLLDLGYQPNHNMNQELEVMLQDLLRFKERILDRKEAIMPKIGFDGRIREFGFIS